MNTFACIQKQIMVQCILRNLAVTALIRNRTQNKIISSHVARNKNAELDKHVHSKRKIATWKLNYYKYVLFNELCFLIFLNECLERIPVFLDTLRRIRQILLIGMIHEKHDLSKSCLRTEAQRWFLNCLCCECDEIKDKNIKTFTRLP